MIEDKLTRDERIRLEALAQANMLLNHIGASTDRVINTADAFEDYIRNGKFKG